MAITELAPEKTATVSLRIPWGSCSAWALAIRQSAGNLGLKLRLEHTADWGAFAEWYDLTVAGEGAAVLAFQGWLKEAIETAQSERRRHDEEEEGGL